MRINRLKHPLLEITGFATAPGQSWCVYGANDSGIETFFAILAGDITPASGEVTLPEKSGVISFKMQQEIYEEELRRDDSDYLNFPDPGTPAHAFLPPGSEQSPLIESFDMSDSLNKGYRQLSSGQSRKLILLREILRGAGHLIIQNPYDGLDEAGCAELDSALATLADHRIQVLVTVNIRNDIPLWCSHLAILHRGRMILQGRRTDLIEQIDRISAIENGCSSTDFEQLGIRTTPAVSENKEIICLRNGFARFGELPVFEGLDLQIHDAFHTLVTGPNGCGKSTLLQIITGDNPKCYANDLRIFGRRRGTGESIWELKHQMGIVSPELHRNYRAPGTIRQVVLSGLFDTIGLYRPVTVFQDQQARHWLDWIDLTGKASISFRRLGFAEQRLVLIARALIKLPRLLVLDEPTQGLDDRNRKKLLDFLDRIAADQICTILYVSHRQDEFRPFFRQHIRLERYVPPPHENLTPGNTPPGTSQAENLITGSTTGDTP